MQRHLLALVAVVALSAACAPPAPGDSDDESGVDTGNDEGEAESGETDSSAQALTRKSSVSMATCPTNGRISQGFSGSHDGIDLANSRGTPIYAVAAGTVTASGPAQGYGQWIRIKHDDGSMTEYGHMESRLVQKGARVSAGQKIALMGSQGESTGPHLHLRTYRSASSVGAGHGMNPVTYLRARGVSLPCKPGAAAAATTESLSAAPTQSTVTVSVWKDAEVMDSATTKGAFVGEVSEDTTYTALCWKAGEQVTSDGYTNDKWVKVVGDGGVTGFVSGIFLRGDKTGGVTTACD